MLRLALLAGLLALRPLLAESASFRLVDAKQQPVADAVVSLIPLEAPAPPASAAAPVVIAQAKEEFLPYVTVIQAGSAIDFPNRDTVKHHVYSTSKAKRFELPLYAGEAREPVRFEQPGVVTLGCNIHDWMLAYVVVVGTPWFAKSGADGAALLAAVPPGRYRAEIWHPRLSAVIARELTIAAGAAAGPSTQVLELGRDRRIRRGVEGKGGGYK